MKKETKIFLPQHILTDYNTIGDDLKSHSKCQSCDARIYFKHPKFREIRAIMIEEELDKILLNLIDVREGIENMGKRIEKTLQEG